MPCAGRGSFDIAMTVLRARGKTKRRCLEVAVSAIRNGGVIIFPTDTIYGILGDATKSPTVRRIFRIKQRKFSKPFPVLISSFEEAKHYAVIGMREERLLKKLWPGPFTAILRYRRGLAPEATLKNSLALRIPKASLIRALLRKVNTPLVATSVNISGEPYRNSPFYITKTFIMRKDRPDYFLNFGRLPRATPSAIIDLSGAAPMVVRG